MQNRGPDLGTGWGGGKRIGMNWEGLTWLKESLGLITGPSALPLKKMMGLEVGLGDLLDRVKD